MLNRERQQDILSFLRTQGGFVTVKALCDRFYASESSIRRDLRALEDDLCVFVYRDSNRRMP